MENETVTVPVETPVEPVATVPEIVAPPEVPEKVYSYQPTDSEGRPLGGRQVIKYRTQDELAQKLTEQNVNLVRELREQTKRNRLGISDEEIVPEGAPRFDTPLEFNPVTLTPDERVQLSRDLLDPEKFEEASSKLFEATIGAKPDTIRNTLTRLSQNELMLLAKVESDAFMSMTPDYYPCRENFKTLTDWMVKNNLQPVRQNFRLAFDSMKNVMVGVPQVEAPAPPVVEPVEPVEPTVEREPILEPVVPAKPAVAPPPTGLREQGNTVVAVPKQVKYTLKDINTMPAETYKHKLLHERGFAEMVENLAREEKEKRTRR